MRKPISILLFVLIAWSCKKVKTQASLPPDKLIYAINLVALSHLDSLLLGNWILDSTFSVEQYSPMLIAKLPTKFYSDPVNCHLLLTQNFVTPNNSDTSYWKNATDGLYCINYSRKWRITSGYLDISGAYYQILSVNSSNLSLHHVESTYYPDECPEPGRYTNFYLHK